MGCLRPPAANNQVHPSGAVGGRRRSIQHPPGPHHFDLADQRDPEAANEAVEKACRWVCLFTRVLRDDH